MLAKRILSCALALCLIAAGSPAAFASYSEALAAEQPEAAIPTVSTENLPAQHAILIEQSTGQVLFEKDADVPSPPASITKVMTLLLVMRAIEDGKITMDDMVSCTEHASSMGGSQIWLEPNEQMSVRDLLKATCVSSANDAAVALAEYVSGSEEAFVELMNQTARELGMQNTTFCNASGLDAPGHLSTARDIAIMSRALLCYPQITEFTTIWMDTLRDGKTQLTNTNKLVRFYGGTTGLKTGTTDGAGHCISASATRNGMSLIAVVMGSKTGDERFSAAKTLLEYGYANYAAIDPPTLGQSFDAVTVRGGVLEQVPVRCEEPGKIVLNKSDREHIETAIEWSGELQAPVEVGQTVGMVRVRVGSDVISQYPIKTAQAVEKMTIPRAMLLLLQSMISLK